MDFDNEKWREIPGWETLYKVSTLGRVKRVGRGKRAQPGRILRPRNRNGYPAVALQNNGFRQDVNIHQLVMLAFVGACPDGQQINHKNGKKDDPRLGNLEYVTPQENIIHARDVLNKKKARGEEHGIAKLTEAAVKEIRQLYRSGVYSHRELGEMFSVSRATIGKIMTGKTWVHV